MADIGRRIDVEFHQEVEITGGRVYLRGDLGVGELIGDLVGFAELAFDLHKKGNHTRLRELRSKLIPNRKDCTSRGGRYNLRWMIGVL
jgi:hypothetical protein